MKRKIFKFAVFLVILLSTGNLTFGQDSNFGKEIIPPVPESAALGKYVETPVSHYTGIPQVSVPLYQLSNGSLQVPVSLSYHAGGIKVEEVASRYGIGWSINLGGVITRSVRNLADDGLNGWFSVTKTSAIDSMSYFAQREEFQDILNGNQDSQADEFYFNFNGMSGKFYFDEKENIRIIPHQKVKIEMIRDTGGFRPIIGWKIISEDGTQYYFGRSSDGITSAVDITTTTSGCNEFNPSSNLYASTWHLLNIISANNSHSIDFQYEQYHINQCNKASESRYAQLTYQGGCGKPDQICYSSNATTGYRIKSVEAGVQKLIMTMGAERLDLPGDHMVESIALHNNANELIGKYNLNYDYFTSTDDLSFNGYCNSSENERRKRLKLESIIEESSAGNVKPAHKFFYNDLSLPERFSHARDHWGYYNQEHTNITSVPDITYSTINGKWLLPGANRSVNAESAKAGILEKIVYPTGGYTTFEYEGNTVSNIGTIEPDKIPWPEIKRQVFLFGDFSATPQSDTFSIKRDTTTNTTGFVNIDISNVECRLDAADGCDIQFYIRGISDPSYSLHIVHKQATFQLPVGTYKIEVNMQQVQPAFENFIFRMKWSNSYYTVNIPTGGLRVKTITDHDDNSDENDIVRVFKYTIEGDTIVSSGYLPFFSSYTYELTEDYTEIVGPATYNIDCLYGVRKSSSNYPLGNSNGSNAEYEHVEVWYGREAENGKTAYFLSIEESGPNAFEAINFPFPPEKRKAWTGGRPLKTIHYKREGDEFFPIQEEINFYNEFMTDTLAYAGMVVDYTLRSVDPSGSNYAYKPYIIPVGLSRLDSAVTKSYTYDKFNTPIVIESYTKHLYENPEHLQLTGSRQLNSKGEVVETRLKYPQDYHAASAIIDSMIARNMINQVIEQMSLVDGRVVSANAKQFIEDPGSGNILPYGEYVAALNTPINGFTFSLDGSSFSAYENRGSYTKYDDKGNLLEVTLDGGFTSAFIWGYDQLLPVARIDQATFSSIEALLGADFHAGSDGLSDAENQLLREQLPDALITTYTYELGVGMKSVTDPNNLTSTYVYDDFGRLKYVKDQDDNVVRRVQYNYKNEK